jgi:hypothetical protein
MVSYCLEMTAPPHAAHRTHDRTKSLFSSNKGTTTDSLSSEINSYFPCQHPRPHQRKVSIHVTTANSTSTTTAIHTNKSSSIHQSQNTQSSPESRSGFSQQPPRSTTVLTVAKSIRLQQPPLTAE